MDGTRAESQHSTRTCMHAMRAGASTNTDRQTKSITHSHLQFQMSIQPTRPMVAPVKYPQPTKHTSIKYLQPARLSSSYVSVYKT